ncbi:RNA recognition motif-containing protein, partial [Toxoplasma gondii ARI]
ALLRRGYRVAH